MTLRYRNYRKRYTQPNSNVDIWTKQDSSSTAAVAQIAEMLEYYRAQSVDETGAVFFDVIGLLVSSTSPSQ